MAIALVNSVASTITGAGTSATHDLPSFNLAAGNTVFATFRNNIVGSPDGPTSVADSAGNTYTQIRAFTLSGGSTHHSLWVCENCLGDATNVVTATYGGGHNFQVGCAAQFSGMTDYTMRATSLRELASNVTITDLMEVHIEDGLIVVALAISTTGSWSAAADFTEAIEDADGIISLAYSIVTVQDSIAPAGTHSSGNQKSIITAVYEGAGIGSPSPGDSGGSSRSRVQRRM